jgi:Telomeric repeat-binding factor 2.
MIKKAFILCLAVLFVLLAGCSLNAQTANTDVDYGTPTTLYTKGQTAKLGYCEITVDDFSVTKDPQKGKEPKAGNEFAVVSLTIKNDGQDSYAYSQDNFTLDISQLKQSVSAVLSDTDYFAGNLEPQKSVQGSIAFEIPEKDTLLLLMFRDLSPNHSGLAQFRLK